MLAYGYPPDDFLQGEYVGSAEHRFGLGGGVHCCRLDYRPFFVPAGIVNVDHEHEPVQLGFGQGVGSFLLDRVLCGQDEEGELQVVCFPARGHMVLLHCLEQGGLGFWRRSVDLVSQDNIGEQRAFYEREHSFARGAVFLDYVGSCDVRGHEVGCELDTVEIELQDLGQCGDHQCFRQTRYADEQAVPAADQRLQQQLDNRILPDDHFVQLGEHFGLGDF